MKDEGVPKLLHPSSFRLHPSRRQPGAVLHMLGSDRSTLCALRSALTVRPSVYLHPQTCGCTLPVQPSTAPVPARLAPEQYRLGLAMLTTAMPASQSRVRFVRQPLWLEAIAPTTS